jgi:DNA invertase Pin-like site-specific DNA recombinase
MKQENSKIEYFLYARKSSESEDRQIQSIDDQINRLKQLAKEQGLIIKRVFTEAKTAKNPFVRPVFTDMMERIEKGEANGILCWQINRLSRNPVDSGRIQWLLQQNILQSIQTIEREYKPEDNTLLFSVESGMANQFIIDLRKNTLRGMNSKVDKGWAPVLAPIGYLNDKDAHTIVVDPEKFLLVRKMWDFMLTGSYSAAQVLDIATNDWGFRTKQYKRRGGGELTQSGVYRMFTNIFYTGLFDWGGKRYTGGHEPMITMDEYDRVQTLLGRTSNARPQKHSFPFTGFIRCGNCGCMVTAEAHTKLVKSKGTMKTYEHYHCTRKKKAAKCSEAYITADDLDVQIEREIAGIAIVPQFRDWALEVIRKSNDKEIDTRTKIYETQQQTLQQTQKQLDNLTRMRYQELIDDAGFIRERDVLQNKILELRQRVKETESRADHWLELTERTFNFATYAHKAFLDGSVEAKKEILIALGSNPLLKDKNLSILTNKWFKRIQKDYPALHAEYDRLELAKHPLNKAQNRALDAVRTGWGA